MSDGDSPGAPQDRWYAEPDRNFEFIGGMKNPIDLFHGRDGKAYVVEIHNDRIQLMDLDGKVLHPRGQGMNQGQVHMEWQVICDFNQVRSCDRAR